MAMRRAARGWGEVSGQPVRQEIDEDLQNSEYGEHTIIRHPPQSDDIMGAGRVIYGEHGIGQPEWRPAPWKVWTVVVLWLGGAIMVGLGLVLGSWWIFGFGWAPIVVGTIMGKLVRFMEYTEEYVPSIERRAAGETPWE